MTTPFTKRPEPMSTLRRILDNAQVAVPGEVACIDTATGNFKPAQAGIATLIPVGTFTEGFTGDGARTTLVSLFTEVRAQQLVNAAPPNNVLDSMVGSPCYLQDGRTVTTHSAGNSVAGLVFGLDPTTGRVLVVPAHAFN